jgi:fumarate reductase flavoprotein subunit
MEDVLIAGAGSAGIPCAIRAAQRGLTVLMIEKDSEAGGTLHITAGHLSAAGTQLQKEKSIEDSPGEHWKDIQRISRNTADEIITHKAVQLAPSTIDWLQRCGYVFHEKTPAIFFGHEAYGKPRTYFGADDYFGGPIMQPGKAVLKALLPLFEELVNDGKIRLHTRHSLVKINTEGTRVVSVEAKTGNTIKKFSAKNYVLTTGGYAANPDFFASHHPGKKLISTARHTSTGDGIIAAMQAGGIFHNAEKYMATLGGIEYLPGSGRVDFWQAWAKVSNSHDRKPREIYVNEHGLRFMNEHDLTVDERERIVMQQPNQRFFVVFSETALEAGPPLISQWNILKFKEEAQKEKCCWTADSIEMLAHKINVPVENFINTVKIFNDCVDNKSDSLFGRTCLEHKIEGPPYYAVLVYASSLLSFGGIKVNEQLQVIHQSGAAFTNLFAAGEILGAGATSGNAFCGGMLLTPAISFGKWLGENIG